MKRFKIPMLLALGLPFALAIFWLAATSRAATESPGYTVVRTEEKFEIRDYPALVVATTPMESGEMNQGFGQLFKFITGSNQGAEKIDMTTPVLIDTASETRTMSFIMPKKALEKGVPKPAGENVTVGKLAAARFAVLRFEGGRSDANEKGAVEKLNAWMKAQKLAAKGAPMFAYYDPPWTPSFMRRNEVMIRLEK